MQPGARDYARMAQRFYEGGNYEKAAECYFNAFSADPSSENAPRYLIKAFLLYHQSGNEKKAEDILRRLKDYWDGFYPAWFAEYLEKDFYTLNPQLLLPQ